MKYTNIKLGNGESTKFWCDKWCEDGILKDKYPRIFCFRNMQRCYGCWKTKAAKFG